MTLAENIQVEILPDDHIIQVKLLNIEPKMVNTFKNVETLSQKIKILLNRNPGRFNLLLDLTRLGELGPAARLVVKSYGYVTQLERLDRIALVGHCHNAQEVVDFIAQASQKTGVVKHFDDLGLAKTWLTQSGTIKP